MTHHPNDETRETVKELSAVGVPQDRIARLLGICEHTLRKHYSDEIALGMAEAEESLKRTAYQLAIGKRDPKDPDKWLVEPDRTMLIFLLKVRCGFRESLDVTLLQAEYEGLERVRREAHAALEMLADAKAAQRPNGGAGEDR